MASTAKLACWTRVAPGTEISRAGGRGREGRGGVVGEGPGGEPRRSPSCEKSGTVLSMGRDRPRWAGLGVRNSVRQPAWIERTSQRGAVKDMRACG